MFRYFLLCLCFIGNSAFATEFLDADNSQPDNKLQSSISSNTILTVDQAFHAQAKYQYGIIEVQFDVTPGHYLYLHGLQFQSQNATLQQPLIPEGKSYHDEHFGEVTIYQSSFSVQIPTKEAAENIDLEVKYQGCSEKGVCYPPQTRQFSLHSAQ